MNAPGFARRVFLVGELPAFQRRYPDARLLAGRSTCLLPNAEREDNMTESVYKVIELIGTSKDSWEKAAAAAVERAGQSLRELRVAEVAELDLQLDSKGKIEAYRAKLKVSFKYET
jgi:flavin-binding protein dodecin